MKLIIETEQDELDNKKIAAILETVANSILTESEIELMDGSYQIETIFGKVWVTHEEEQ